MTTPISELAIAALVRNFAIAAGKRRLIDAVDAVAEHLVELGVEVGVDVYSHMDRRKLRNRVIPQVIKDQDLELLFRPSGLPIRGPADLKGQFVSKP